MNRLNLINKLKKENMAESAGSDIRKLVFTYTGLDTHKLVNNILNK